MRAVMTPPAVDTERQRGRHQGGGDLVSSRMCHRKGWRPGQRHRRGTVGDGLVGVDALLGIEEVGNELDNTGNTSGTTDEYNLVHVGLKLVNL